MTLVPVLALAWTVLVWVNWLGWNWLSFADFHNALAPFGVLSIPQAGRAILGDLPLLGWCAVFWLAAHGAGRPAGWWLVPGRRGVLFLVLGASLIGLGGFGAGLAGIGFPVVARVMVIGAAVAARPDLRPSRGRWMVQPSTLPFLLVLGAGILVPLVGALAPEASYDGMAHHLAHPELYAARHRVHALPSHFLATYPALLEMQYFVARLVAGTPQLARLVHWGWGILTLAVLVGWAREILDDAWALAAAAACALVPYIQVVMMWAYVDLGAACLVTLAVREALARRSRPVLLGVLCGLAAGVKVTGIFAAAVTAGILVSRRVPVAAWRGWGLGALAVAAPWGLRNLLVAGNPAAPFLASYLPTLWWGAANHARYQQELASYAVGPATLHGFPGVLARPWDITMRNTGVLDARGGLGGWFLWGLPLVLLSSSAVSRSCGAASIGWYMLWHLIPLQVRYLLPIWPVAVLAIAGAVRDAVRGAPGGRFMAWGLAVLLAWHLPGALRLQREAADPVRVVFGAEPPGTYLARGMPGHEPALRTRDWLAAHADGTRALVANQYGLGLMWGPQAVVQSFFDTPLLERFTRESGDTARLARRFREAGIGRVVCDTENSMLMQSTYHMYSLTPAEAARWQAYWQRAARLEYAADGRLLVYRLDRPGRPAPASVVPGVDEQALAAADDAESAAEARGQSPADLAKAEALYESIARRTGLPAAWERVGLVRARAGRRPAAREALRRAIALGRDTAAVHNGLGIIEAQDGRLAPAMTAFRRALALDPGFTNARRNLALCLRALGRTPEALAVVQEGLAKTPAAPDLREVWGVLAGPTP